jgi:NRPS condensation-like uncharacterized protein
VVPHTFDFERVDLSRMDKHQRQLRLSEVIDTVHRQIDIVHGPVFAAVLFDYGPGMESRLLMVAHHLIMDAVSWRILVEDLESAYLKSSMGEPIELPPVSASYAAWSRQLYESAKTARFQHMRLPFRAPGTCLNRIALDQPHGFNTEASTSSVKIEFSEEVSAEIRVSSMFSWTSQTSPALELNWSITAASQAARIWICPAPSDGSQLFIRCTSKYHPQILRAPYGP